ncbi:MAG: hypothetical protein IJ455_06175 [Agathobacter sp.]|nr:hypothetical protein [Agathobacter sp.]
MNSTEVISTEIIEESTELEAVVEVEAAALVPYLEQMAFDLRVILLFTILTFVRSCMRSWRKTTTGGFN